MKRLCSLLMVVALAPGLGAIAQATACRGVAVEVKSSCLLAVTEPGQRVEFHGGPLPTADTPEGAVRRLLTAYCNRDLDGYAAMLARRFTIMSYDPDPRPVRGVYRRREDEVVSAAHLLHGFIDSSGVWIPGAVAIAVTIGNLRVPVRRPESRYRAALADSVKLSVRRRDGSGFETSFPRYSFIVVRAESSAVAADQLADPARWIVLRWYMMPYFPQRARPSTLVTPQRPPAPRAADSLQARSPSLAPLRLAFMRTPNPAHWPVRLIVEVPERGSAQVEVFDVQGRRVSINDLGEREPGDYTVPATSGVQLAPGTYWFRLTQNRRAVTTRIVILS
jgi:hypothetical protein